jgi:PAS domain S-box-containing protein
LGFGSGVVMQKIYDYFLTKYLEKDYTGFARAKLILQFCLVTALFSLFYSIVANLIDFKVSAYVMPIMALLFLGLAYLFKTNIGLRIISHSYLFLSYIASIILILHSGLIYSSIVPWLAFIPMAANLLGNKRAAIGWLIVSIITVFSVMGFTPIRELPDIGFDQTYEPFFFAIVHSGLIGIILVLSMVFQKSKDKYLELLEEKNVQISGFNKELKSKNDEIISQNKELIQQKAEIFSQREFIELKNRELLNIQDELNDIIEKLTNTQTELGNREAENRSILEAIYGTQLLVCELDLDGRFIRLNTAFLEFLMLDEAQVAGKKFSEISRTFHLTLDNTVGFKTIWERVLAGHHSSHEVSLKVGKKRHWLKENFFPIVDENGLAVKIMVIAQDISQIKNQKDKIELLNNELTNKIYEIERQNNLLISQRKEIEKVNEEISKSNKEIKDINSSLEKRVQERTKILEEKNRQLAEYAYINSHLLRAPLCSILGLVNLLETKSKKEQEMVVFHMKKSSKELHEVVKKITKAIEDGSHFDRKLLSEN